MLKFPGKIVEIFCFIIKLESNTNFFPGWFLIKNRGVTFKARKLLSYSLWTQHHSRIVILEKISTFFSPSCSYSLQRVACFNLGFPFFQINFVFTFLFCFLCFFFLFFVFANFVFAFVFFLIEQLCWMIHLSPKQHVRLLV